MSFIALGSNEWLILSSMLPIRVCYVKDLCFMCNLELNDVITSTKYMKSLGLLKLVGEQVNVTNVCLKLMLGKLSKSKRRVWTVVKCRDGYENLLKSMGFIGRGTTLFAPFMRLMISEVSERCDVIAVCSSKMLSELWKLRVGGLTPWSSLSSSIEARDRALKCLKFKGRGFAYAVEASARKLIEAFMLARDLSCVLDLRSSLEVLREELKVDLSSLFERDAVERSPLKAISILDGGIESCRSYLEERTGARRNHLRFEDVEGFDFHLGV